jgi:hypothetical protein
VLVEVDAAPTHDLHRREEVGGLEARAVDDHVDLVHPAVGRADALGGDLGDGVGHEVDVVAGEGPGPGPVVEDEALGEGRVLGDHLLLQLGVALELAPQ